MKIEAERVAGELGCSLAQLRTFAEHAPERVYRAAGVTAKIRAWLLSSSAESPTAPAALRLALGGDPSRSAARDRSAGRGFAGPAAPGAPRAALKPGRRGLKLGRGPWWMRYGSHPDQVIAWLKAPHSDDPGARELVRRLLKAIDSGRGVEWWRYPEIAKPASLAFALYYSRSATTRAGYSGCVAGVPRGVLANICGYRYRGLALCPSSVSRALTRLGELLGGRRVKKGGALLGGLLDIVQPSPAEAEARDLPHTVGWSEGGKRLVQPLNLYWFRSFGKIGGGGARRGSSLRGDPGARNQVNPIFRSGSVLPTGKESGPNGPDG
jgi:hypothetical protein